MTNPYQKGDQFTLPMNVNAQMIKEAVTYLQKTPEVTKLSNDDMTTWTPEMLQALLSSGEMQYIKSLSLKFSSLDSNIIKELAESQVFPNLTELELKSFSRLEINGETITSTNTSSLFQKLTSLNLPYKQTEVIEETLKTCPNLKSFQVNLDGNNTKSIEQLADYCFKEKKSEIVKDFNGLFKKLIELYKKNNDTIVNNHQEVAQAIFSFLYNYESIHAKYFIKHPEKFSVIMNSRDEDNHSMLHYFKKAEEDKEFEELLLARGIIPDRPEKTDIPNIDLQKSINETNVHSLVSRHPDKIDQFIDFIVNYPDPQLQPAFLEIINGNVNVNTPEKIGLVEQEIFGKIYNLFLTSVQVQEILPKYNEISPTFEEYKTVVEHIISLPKVQALAQKLELEKKTASDLPPLTSQANQYDLAREHIRPSRDLLEAAKTGNIAQVNKLIAEGVYLNYSDLNGQTALHVAATAEIATALLAGDANKEATDNCGRTPLLTACRANNLDVAQTLIENKANVDHVDSFGENALLAILKHSEVNADLFNKLIEHKIDIQHADKQGNTALHYAKIPELARILRQQGAEVNKCNKNNNSPLEYLDKNYRDKKLMSNETFAQIAKESIKDGANSYSFWMWSNLLDDPILKVPCTVRDLLSGPDLSKIKTLSEAPSLGEYIRPNFLAHGKELDRIKYLRQRHLDPKTTNDFIASIEKEVIKPEDYAKFIAENPAKHIAIPEKQQKNMAHLVEEYFVNNVVKITSSYQEYIQALNNYPTLNFKEKIWNKVVQATAERVYLLGNLLSEQEKQDISEIKIVKQIFLSGADSFKEGSEQKKEELIDAATIKLYQDDPSLFSSTILKIIDIVVGKAQAAKTTPDEFEQFKMAENIFRLEQIMLADKELSGWGTDVDERDLKSRLSKIKDLLPEAEKIKDKIGPVKWEQYYKYDDILQTVGESSIATLQTSLKRHKSEENLLPFKLRKAGKTNSKASLEK